MIVGAVSLAATMLLVGVADAGKVHEWAFEDNTNDTSGSGNHGVIGSGAETYVAGAFGQAISLAAENIDGVQAAMGTTANIPTGGTASWSQNVWINLDAPLSLLTNLAGFGRLVEGPPFPGVDGSRRSFLSFTGSDSNDFYSWGLDTGTWRSLAPITMTTVNGTCIPSLTTDTR
jgi:hypothetical protein